MELTGLADFVPEDPEPEFVSINSRNQVVVTLQENNHIVVVDLASGSVVTDFTAAPAPRPVWTPSRTARSASTAP